jgi:hypothetical protein
MYYFISKKKCGGNVLFLDFNKIDGYKVNPKNKIADGIVVSEMTIVKPYFINQLLKKKVRIMLEILDEESDSDDSRKALDDVQRYRYLINEKYSKFLDPKYISLLNQKIDILEREFKNNLALAKQKETIKQIEEEMQKQYDMQDQIEEKENKRR